MYVTGPIVRWWREHELRWTAEPAGTRHHVLLLLHGGRRGQVRYIHIHHAELIDNTVRNNIFMPVPARVL